MWSALFLIYFLLTLNVAEVVSFDLPNCKISHIATYEECLLDAMQLSVPRTTVTSINYFELSDELTVTYTMTGGEVSNIYETNFKQTFLNYAKHIEPVLGLMFEGPDCISQPGQWTDFFNIDSPNTGDGDHETRIAHGKVCPENKIPLAAECRNIDGLKWDETNQMFSLSCSTEGVKCENSQNRNLCQDYKIRYFCPAEVSTTQIILENEYRNAEYKEDSDEFNANIYVPYILVLIILLICCCATCLYLLIQNPKKESDEDKWMFHEDKWTFREEREEAEKAKMIDADTTSYQLSSVVSQKYIVGDIIRARKTFFTDSGDNSIQVKIGTIMHVTQVFDNGDIMVLGEGFEEEQVIEPLNSYNIIKTNEYRGRKLDYYSASPSSSPKNEESSSSSHKENMNWFYTLDQSKKDNAVQFFSESIEHYGELNEDIVKDMQQNFGIFALQTQQLYEFLYLEEESSHGKIGVSVAPFLPKTEPIFQKMESRSESSQSLFIRLNTQYDGENKTTQHDVDNNSSTVDFAGVLNRKMESKLDLPAVGGAWEKLQNQRAKEAKERQDERLMEEAGTRVAGTKIRCPIWYSRLNQDIKINIKNLIGNSSRNTKDLENLIVDQCRINRKDIQDLLRWWFHGQQTLKNSNSNLINLNSTTATEWDLDEVDQLSREMKREMNRLSIQQNNKRGPKMDDKTPQEAYVITTITNKDPMNPLGRWLTKHNIYECQDLIYKENYHHQDELINISFQELNIIFNRLGFTTEQKVKLRKALKMEKKERESMRQAEVYEALHGQWLSKQDYFIMIHDNEVMWPDDHVSRFHILEGENRIQLHQKGNDLIGLLRNDITKIIWTDGDIWSKTTKFSNKYVGRNKVRTNHKNLRPKDVMLIDKYREEEEFTKRNINYRPERIDNIYPEVLDFNARAIESIASGTNEPHNQSTNVTNTTRSATILECSVHR